MGATDTYKNISTREKDDMFTELFKLKEDKKLIDERIKEIEDIYKPDVKDLDHDVFFVLRNGIRFSIKRSTRVGSINANRLEKAGVNVADFRNKPSVIHTLRVDV